ncbi:serine/threonine-protein kinase [Nonomuraea polychroma]|uniref:serine/threonine-protein kinase n=1 Tax=Nonomuraea polychroma TaxID=46176 RepID=UPI003D8DD179
MHRDLKPANILLSAVGPRVIDFGIARIVEPDSTRSVEIVGTPAFMSPEQAHGDPVTAASDVFAWGGVVTYAATGRAPFGTGGAPEVLFRVVHYVPGLTGLDERLRPLVEQALAKEPGRRPTAQQILDRLLGRESITMSVASHAVSDSWMARRLRADRDTVPSRQSGNGRQWTRPAAMIGAALAVAPAGTGTALWRPWEGAPSTSPTLTSPVPTTPAPTAPVLAKADAVTTNIDGVRVPIHITIDALKRTPDDTVRLEWTVRNDRPFHRDPHHLEADLADDQPGGGNGQLAGPATASGCLVGRAAVSSGARALKVNPSARQISGIAGTTYRTS